MASIATYAAHTFNTHILIDVYREKNPSYLQIPLAHLWKMSTTHTHSCFCLSTHYRGVIVASFTNTIFYINSCSCLRKITFFSATCPYVVVIGNVINLFSTFCCLGLGAFLEWMRVTIAWDKWKGSLVQSNISITHMLETTKCLHCRDNSLYSNFQNFGVY